MQCSMETTLLEAKNIPTITSFQESLIRNLQEIPFLCKHVFQHGKFALETWYTKLHKKGSNILPLKAVGPCTFFSVFAKNKRI